MSMTTIGLHVGWLASGDKVIRQNVVNPNLEVHILIFVYELLAGDCYGPPRVLVSRRGQSKKTERGQPQI